MIFWFTVILGLAVGAFFFLLAYHYAGAQVNILQIESIGALCVGINNFISIAIGSPSEMEQSFMLPSVGKGGYNITIHDDYDADPEQELPGKVITITLSDGSPVNKPLSARNIISYEINYPTYDRIAIKKFSMANTFTTMSLATNVMLVYTPLQVIIVPDSPGGSGTNCDNENQLKLIEKIKDMLSAYDRIVIPGDREYMFLTPKKKFSIGSALDMDIARNGYGNECDSDFIENVAEIIKNIYFPTHKALKTVIILSTETLGSDVRENIIKELTEGTEKIYGLKPEYIIFMEKGSDDKCYYKTTLYLEIDDEYELYYVFCPLGSIYPLMEYFVSSTGPVDALSYQYTQIYEYMNLTVEKAKKLKKIFCPDNTDCPCMLSSLSEREAYENIITELEAITDMFKEYRTRDALLSKTSGFIKKSLIPSNGGINPGDSLPIIYNDIYCKNMDIAENNCELIDKVENIRDYQSKLIECSLPEV